MEVRTENYGYSPFNGENRDIRDVYIYKGDDEKVLKVFKEREGRMQGRKKCIEEGEKKV